MLFDFQRRIESGPFWNSHGPPHISALVAYLLGSFNPVVQAIGERDQVRNGDVAVTLRSVKSWTCAYRRS